MLLPHQGVKLNALFEKATCVNVFIVEDTAQTCRELVELVTALPGFKVVGQAASVQEAIDGIERTTPEAVTLDISLSDGSGVEVLKHIRRLRADIFVVVLTGNPYEALRTTCRRLGAAAVLDKFNGLAQAADVLLAGRRTDPARKSHEPKRS
jgi:two-component system, NarL family, response regulator DevR